MFILHFGICIRSGKAIVHTQVLNMFFAKVFVVDSFTDPLLGGAEGWVSQWRY